MQQNSWKPVEIRLFGFLPHLVGFVWFYASQTGSPNKPSAPWPHLLTPWLMLSKWKMWMKISWIKHQLSSDLISSWFPDFDFLLKKSWFNSWFRIETTNNEWYKGCPLLDQDGRDVNLTSTTSNDARMGDHSRSADCGKGFCSSGYLPLRSANCWGTWYSMIGQADLYIQYLMRSLWQLEVGLIVKNKS